MARKMDWGQSRKRRANSMQECDASANRCRIPRRPSYVEGAWPRARAGQKRIWPSIIYVHARCPDTSDGLFANYLEISAADFFQWSVNAAKWQPDTSTNRVPVGLRFLRFGFQSLPFLGILE